MAGLPLVQAPVLLRKSSRSGGGGIAGAVRQRHDRPMTMARLQRACPRALVCAVIGVVRAVGGDEVDQRFRMLQVHP